MKTRCFHLALCVLGVIVPNAPFFRLPLFLYQRQRRLDVAA